VAELVVPSHSNHSTSKDGAPDDKFILHNINFNRVIDTFYTTLKIKNIKLFILKNYKE
jgi:hypothetical protein